MTASLHSWMGKRPVWVLTLFVVPLLSQAQPLASTSANIDRHRYAIEVAGIQVGTMTATRQSQTDEAVTYTLISDVNVSFLVYKLRIYYKVVDRFQRGQLQFSTVETHTNKGDFSSRVEWRADHYEIVSEQYKHSYRAVDRNPITSTVTTLYFAEPTNQSTVFTEYFGDYFTLSPGKTSGTYRARREGREDEYQYDRGRLVKIIKKNPLKNFIIKPIP